ncbi:retrotransposon protein, putative, ty1-copia subclass [Tanacetum coccineum]
MVRSMMSQTTLPKSFWDYALESATHILNMVPTKKVEKTPYEIWHGQAPKLSYLKVWGCEALVKRDTLTKPDKLEPISIKCIFIGYPKETMASGSIEDLEIIQEEDTHPSINTSLHHDEDDQEIDEPQSDINLIRRSTRTQRASYRMCLYIDAEEYELGDHNEPANYKAALLDPEFDKWLDAMNVEMKSMKDNEVWDLVDLPPDGKTVGSKWLFKKKTDMDGVVHTYKARLVAKGFTQTYRVDYEETFSPVADIRAIRILIAITVFYDYEIWQMNVKTAFFNGHLSLKKSIWCNLKTGYVFVLNGGVVDWKNTKQSIFATSFVEARYIAAYDASKEAVWIRKFIFGLSVVPKIEEPITMYCDNTRAITIANESAITKGARHYRAKVHYLHEVIELGDIKLEKVHTYENLADPFTNALPLAKHSEHSQNIGMLPASSLM